MSENVGDSSYIFLSVFVCFGGLFRICIFVFVFVIVDIITVFL